MEELGNLFLVGLDLVVGFPDVGIFVGGILEFQQYQWQAIDEQMMSGRRVWCGPRIENWLTASQALRAGSLQSISLTKSPRVSPATL